MPLFDTYLVVDWSARATPARGADSIWIAVVSRDGEAALSNPPTRRAAEAELRAAIMARQDERVLLGIDVGLGYPAGTAELLDVTAPGVPAWRATWRAIASRIVDDDRNGNNRFEVAASLNGRSAEPAGPFWGCPHGRVVAGLAPTRPPAFALGAYRATERVLRDAGRAPMSMWQLTGTGSVGSQTLTALPVLHRLLDDPSLRVDVWPFTTGFGAPVTEPGGVLVAEVWPTMFDPPYPVGTIRDAAQVAHVAHRCREADASGELATWFEPFAGGSEPGGIDPAVIIDEEGWVLGPPP